MERKEREKAEFDNYYTKQMVLLNRYFKLFFQIFGGIFAVVGLILILLDVRDENNFLVGLVFLPLGILFMIIGIIVRKLLPKDYNYDKYKTKMKKYGVVNIFEVSTELEIAKERITSLEEEIQLLKEDIEMLKKRN